MKGYIKEFDSLRAFSVLAVMFQHYLGQFKALSILGSCGVTMFFVLSGYLITQILLYEKQKYQIDFLHQREAIPKVLKIFYYRRSLRIFPIYYITLIVLCILSVGTAREFAGYHFFYASNFLYSFKIDIMTTSDTLAHFWSLSVEEQFYLIWPLLILLYPRNRNIIPFFIFLIAFSVAFKFLMIDLYSEKNLAYYFLMPSCIESFACGAIAVCISNRKISKKALYLTCILSGLMFLLVQAALYFNLINHYVILLNVLGRTIFSIFSAGILLLILTKNIGGFAQKVLTNRYLMLIGKMSYGVYIYHAFVPGLLSWLQELCGISLSGYGVLIPLMFIVTFAISYFSFFFIETPINNLKKRFVY